MKMHPLARTYIVVSPFSSSPILILYTLTFSAEYCLQSMRGISYSILCHSRPHFFHAAPVARCRCHRNTTLDSYRQHSWQMTLNDFNNVRPSHYWSRLLCSHTRSITRTDLYFA
jgi:hypothetical protein